MRLLAFYLFVLAMHVSAKSSSQNVTMSAKNSSLKEIFTEVEKQTGYMVFYSRQLLKNTTPVSVDAVNIPLNEFLEKILEKQPLKFTIRNKTIVIKEMVNFNSNERRKQSLSPVVESPPIKISGTVVGENSQPLAGATIKVKGKGIIVVSDEKGYFELSADLGNTVIISYVGFQEREFKINNGEQLLIFLRQAESRMDTAEVVVSTGYQQIPKERATGSFSHVDNELFNRRVGANILDRLNDVVPGLVKTRLINSTALSGFQIRGRSTINAETTPLLVVDNFIFEGDPSTINPNDIESVTVLKDAAAASIWGVRAGNGVIVITTKKGKRNRHTTLSFNTNVSISTKPDIQSIPSVPSKDVVALERRRYNEGDYNALLTSPNSYQPLPLVAEILYKKDLEILSDSEAEALLQELENTDVKSEIHRYLMQNPSTQQYSFGISGGSDKNQYIASFGYDKSVPSEINIRDERLTFRWNDSWQPIRGLNITTEINWVKADRNSNNNLANGQEKLLIYAYNKLIDAEGNPLPIQSNLRNLYTDSIRAPGLLDWHFYPLKEAKNGQSISKSNDIRFFGTISYQISPSITATAQYQYQQNTSEDKNIRSLEIYDTRDFINKYVQTDPMTGSIVYPIPKGGIYSRSTANLTSWNFRGSVNFNKSFNQHSIVALAAVETRETNRDQTIEAPQYGFSRETNTFQTMLPGMWRTRPNNFSTLLTIPPSTLFGSVNRFGSYLANISYTLDHRYILTASGRIDQSNFFGAEANDRIVPLWSTGLAWNITNESFFQSKAVDELTLRFTYGYSGNVNPGISPLATASYFQPTDPTNIPYASLVTAPNPNLGWEKVKQINVASDFSLFNNKLSGTLEFYAKYGINLISAIESAPSTGFLKYNGNNASVRTKGMDLNLTNNNKFGQFKLTNVLILSYNTNKVTNYLVEVPTGTVTPSQFSNTSFPQIGKPIDKLYTYKWAGLSGENGDAQIYVNDKILGSKQARTMSKLEDFEYSGRLIPSWTGAWRTEVGWKNLSISIGINYRFKSVFLRNSFTGTFRTDKNFQHKDYLKAWKIPGDEKITNVPGFADSYSDQRYTVYSQSNILVESGDIIQLQDVRLNCDLKPYFKGIKVISKLVLYLYADNIGTIWKESKYDPRVGGAFSYNRNLTTFFGGLSVQF